MNTQYNNEAMQIVTDLYDEFSKEELKLKVKYDNNCAKLDEMDQQIRALSRSEDTEMRVSLKDRKKDSLNKSMTVCD